MVPSGYRIYYVDKAAPIDVDEQELWKAHPIFAKYEVSTVGRVRHHQSKKVLKPKVPTEKGSYQGLRIL